MPDPPGTPKPATGAPGDRPGRGDPFGTQGGKAEEQPSEAEAVSELAKLRITRIEVHGNERTPAWHIKDHLTFQQGDDLDEEEVRVSRVRLLQLGPFSSVQAEVEPGDEPGAVTVVITVKERVTVFITDLLYGSTVTTPFYAGAGVAVADMFHTGLSLSAQGLAGGSRRWAARLSLYTPDVPLGGTSFVFGVQGLVQRNLENACGDPACYATGRALSYGRTGGQATVGFWVGEFQRFLFGYRYEALDASLDGAAPPGAGPFILPGRSHLSALTFSFDRDGRNETFLPTRGSRVQALITLSSRALASSYEYSRFQVQYEQWLPLPEGMALRTDLVLGAVQGDAPFFERFYAADWSYFALGLATSRLLDLNLSPDARYDRILAVLGAEYDILLWKAPGFWLPRGYVALGARAVYSAAEPGGPRTPVSAIPVSADVSVRVESPVGVLSVSVGYVLDLIF